MANTVIALKKSATPSATPTNLANGELAINYADGKLYYKHANGSIAEISGSGGGNAFGTVNANSTLVVADSPSSILTIVPGNNIQIVGDAINDTITISASVPGGGDPAPAFNQANTSRNHANGAFATSNLALSVAQTAFNFANTSNNFLALQDTPFSYAGANGYFVVVNATETGLSFTPDINLDELIFTARSVPNTPIPDSVTVYVTTSGVSPNKEVAFKIKNESGEEIILSSVLT